MIRLQYKFLVLTAFLMLAASSCVYRADRKTDASDIKSTQPTIEATPSRSVQKPEKDKKIDKGDFIVEHLEVKNSRYAEIARQVRDEKLLEKVADKLSRSLILPHDIYLQTKDCGEVNAFYSSKNRSVTVCFELMEHFYKVFRSDGLSDEKAYDKMFDATRFAFLHEIGHALVDTYNLPITGNEEDAADRCSSFINLTELGEDGITAVVAAADSFAIESRNGSKSNRNLADEHLLQEQRFYNSICMLYGSDPEKYAYILKENYLPAERAARCPQEYERTVNSWSSLLAPWRKEY